MKRSVFAGTVIGPLCALAMPAGAAPLPNVTVGKPPFSEETPQLRRFSVDDFMGVISAAPPSAKAGATLTIAGIDAGDRTLCVHIEHSSGGYRADFDIPNPKLGDTVRFVLPSEQIGKLHSQQTAIRVQASRQEKCFRNSPFLPAAWGNQLTLSSIVLVNSQQADLVTTYLDGGKAQPCKKITDVAGARQLSVSSFDMTCELSLPAKCRQQSTLSIQRRDGPEYRPPVQIALRLPCPR